jgi:hypothetical protein
MMSAKLTQIEVDQSSAQLGKCQLSVNCRLIVG